MSSLLVLLCYLVGIRGHFWVNFISSYNLLDLLKHPLVDSSEGQTSICTLRDGDDDQLLVSVMHAVYGPGRRISTWRMRLQSSTFFMNIVTRQWMVHGSKTNLCAPVFRFGECRADSGDAVCPATNYHCFRGELASSFPQARKTKTLFEVGFCRSDAAELSDWKANYCQHKNKHHFHDTKKNMNQGRT